MNERQKKKRIDKLFMCRLGRYGEIASTIRIKNDIIQRHSKAPENDPLRILLNQLVEELEDIYYMMHSDYYELRKPIKLIIEEAHEKVKEEGGRTMSKWTDEDCDCIGCWECKYFRQDKNIHNPYDEKDAYYCAHKKLYISGNMARPDYMDMRYTDFNRLGCKEEE